MGALNQGSVRQLQEYEKSSKWKLVQKGHQGRAWAEAHAALYQQTAGDSSGDDITPCVTCSVIASPRGPST